MRNIRILYSLVLLLMSSAALTSCVDEPLVKDGADGEPHFDGYSINVTLTLDPMGGTRDSQDPLLTLENYINPELLRILFFDYQERFLFESKSRWVKKLNTNGDYSSWLVSVPFYQVGNDNVQDPDHNYDWKWDEIRTLMKEHPFKVVVMANRPTTECYPDLAKEAGLGGGGTKDFENSGPNWTRDDTGVKKLIDLHHTQWDPIYSDKGYMGEGASENYYDFISERGPVPAVQASLPETRRLQMSSTTSWVDHGPTFTDDGEKDGNGNRYWRLPDENYPIPMYGVQDFDALTNWEEGVPFDLSDPTNSYDPDYKTYRSIALLRSVVKLELLIDKDLGSISYIGHKYPNVYARCEPMDVWTPTDELWAEDHEGLCDMDCIMAYGAISNKNETNQTENSNAARTYFRKKMSWFFGRWMMEGPDGEPRWKFGEEHKEKYGYTVDFSMDQVPEGPYPRIFNPVTQRNGNVRVGNKNERSMYYTDNYYHYVVYTGERNMNHPSYLYALAGDGSGGSGQSVTMSWVVAIGEDVYNIPIKDFNNSNAYLYKYSGYTGENAITLTDVKEDAVELAGKEKDHKVPNNRVTYDYQKDVYSAPYNEEVLPWPLVRNHVYRIVIGGSGAPFDNGTRSGKRQAPVLKVVSSENRSSRSIKFK
ncbi:MAG: hypothetical protein J1E84_03045 [Muribaculaceae bacterium]|nr:hypothetical protein [Muribaculaceae bacterium]